MRTRYVIAALLLIPLADAILLVFVAGEIGPVPTVLLVVLTGLVGMLLVRAEGRHTLARIQRKLARGEPPTDELLDGALLIAAGAFLLTPGVVTDALGFLLALPPTRYPIRTLLKRYVVVPKLDEQTGGFVTGGVWTSGFPDEGDGDAGNSPFGGNGPFDGGNAGPFDGGNAGPRDPLRGRFVVVPKLDEQTGGFVTGGVWTSGFPDEGDGDAGNSPFGGNGPFDGGNAGPFDGGNAGPFDPDGGANGASDANDDGDDVYDVGADEYRTKDE